MDKISHHRRSARSKLYDYSQPGAYFATVCTEGRNCLFGKVENGQMRLNDIGQMVDIWWRKIFEKYDNISAEEYVIMPNHIHKIINIVGAIPRNRPVSNVKNETIIHDNMGENTVSERGENTVSPLHRKNMGSKTLSSFVAGCRSAVTKQINELRQTPGIPVWQRNKI